MSKAETAATIPAAATAAAPGANTIGGVEESSSSAANAANAVAGVGAGAATPMDKLKAMIKKETYEALKTQVDATTENEKKKSRGNRNIFSKDCMKTTALRWVVKPTVDGIVDNEVEKQRRIIGSGDGDDEHKKEENRNDDDDSSSSSSPPPTTTKPHDDDESNGPAKATVAALHHQLPGRIEPPPPPATRSVDAAKEAATAPSSRPRPSTDNGVSKNNSKKVQQELVMELLSTMDKYSDQLTKDEQKNAMNAFNAAVAFKMI